MNSLVDEEEVKAEVRYIPTLYAHTCRLAIVLLQMLGVLPFVAMLPLYMHVLK